ncbi:hypothetical protein QFZ49_000350 [Streptomyces turgidiscabies]|uniref:Uncharacterized protein n=1 Tax=Streptomyces turgidiscabies TaxID=85558 RepID=A0ABU0RER8_9ACTN|nr:hypothetical protein [Streptomyces turgidiscabies]
MRRLPLLFGSGACLYDRVLHDEPGNIPAQLTGTRDT